MIWKGPVTAPTGNMSILTRPADISSILLPSWTNCSWKMSLGGMPLCILRVMVGWAEARTGPRAAAALAATAARLRKARLPAAPAVSEPFLGAMASVFFMDRPRPALGGVLRVECGVEVGLDSEERWLDPSQGGRTPAG